MATTNWQAKYTNTASDFSSVTTTGTAIHSLLAGAGWVQTADTGQVAWGSYTFALSTSVYEIWGMSDAGQSTLPCFMKLTYTVNPSGFLQIFVELGIATNGTGTLTGSTTSSYGLAGNWGTTDTTLRNCYAAAGNNWFTLLTFCGGTEGGILAVERSLNNDGTYGTSYVSLSIVAANGLSAAANLMPSGSGSPPVTAPQYLLSSSTSTVFNGLMQWCPIFPVVGGLQNPMTTMGACRIGEAGDQSTQIVTLYGTQHTYLHSSALPATNSNSNASIGIRYE